MSLRVFPFWFVLTVVLSQTSELGAQSSVATESASAAGSSTGSAYRAAIQRALEEYALHNYAEAREQFRVAHELEPSARTLRGLGLTEFELRNYPESVKYLEQALASNEKPLSGETRTGTESALDNARGYVGEVAIELQPKQANVTIDGQQLELSSTPLLLAVGDYVLEFRATGRITQRRVVKVTGRQRQELAIELAELSSPASEQASALSTEHRPDRPPVYKRWWLWTTVGVVAAAAGVTTALLVRRSSTSEYEERPTPSGNMPDGLAAGLPLPSP